SLYASCHHSQSSTSSSVAFTCCLTIACADCFCAGGCFAPDLIFALAVPLARTAELCDFIRNGAEAMMKYQRPDGYLGTYRNSRNFFPPTKEEAIAATGAATMWNWNIWCRKYTLWGMLECYMLLGDERM
ncbi:MAG: hypothetical protein U0L88_07850, partial [Acutalibacteraceae bacterium]|nr:hypothetical protein [Acutalibacteraceae bacterium]